jgi:hypothetical protein
MGEGGLNMLFVGMFLKIEVCKGGATFCFIKYSSM